MKSPPSRGRVDSMAKQINSPANLFLHSDSGVRTTPTRKNTRKSSPRSKLPRKHPLPRDPTERRQLAIDILATDDPNARRRGALEGMDINDISVVDQVWLATQRDNIGATFGGFLVGGIVPLGTYLVAHYEVTKAVFYTDPMSLLVLGGLMFSLITVYGWGKKAFNDNVTKALGFVVLIEGIMVFSTTVWLSIMCLVYLIAINGIATGVQLALQRWSDKTI